MAEVVPKFDAIIGRLDCWMVTSPDVRWTMEGWPGARKQ